jgi:hypothetical protein
VVEGSASRRNLANDRIKIIEHMPRRYPQHTNPVLGQPGITSDIPRGPVAHIVRHSVHLDTQLGALAVEVENVGPAWMLAAKFVAVRPLPQDSPKQTFGQG